MSSKDILYRQLQAKKILFFLGSPKNFAVKALKGSNLSIMGSQTPTTPLFSHLGNNPNSSISWTSNSSGYRIFQILKNDRLSNSTGY